MSDKDRIAARERDLAELKGKIDPPKGKSNPMSDAEWRDQMHQLAEKRMSMATPPSVVRDWAVIPEDIVRGIVQDRHAPTGPSSAGASGTVGRVSSNPGIAGSGWSEPRPLSNPPGTHLVDALCIADDVRQRAELKRKLGGG
jgi:hypothetical protein